MARDLEIIPLGKDSDRLVGGRAAGEVAHAAEARETARQGVERITPLSFRLPATGLAANRVVVSVEEAILAREGRQLFGPLSLAMRDPERIAIAGPNGAGKSSLLKLISGELSATAGTVRTGVPAAYLAGPKPGRSEGPQWVR